MTKPEKFTSRENSGEDTIAETWRLRQPISAKLIVFLLAISVLLGLSAHRSQMDRAFMETLGAVGSLFGWGESRVIKGAANFIGKSFPLVLEERTEVSRISDFDPNDLPMFAYLKIEETREYDTETEAWKIYSSQWLINPYGYLWRVIGKMADTIEIAIWGTILSVSLALPLAFFAAKNYSPSKILYHVARAICSFNRAVPDLISALFFVLMYGFGPIAGILALGFHTSGFLGKFFADEIENADPGPQLALSCTGASRLQVLRFAVLPQVVPQYFAYVQYILERGNVPISVEKGEAGIAD